MPRRSDSEITEEDSSLLACPTRSAIELSMPLAPLLQALMSHWLASGVIERNLAWISLVGIGSLVRGPLG